MPHPAPGSDGRDGKALPGQVVVGCAAPQTGPATDPPGYARLFRFCIQKSQGDVNHKIRMQDL